MQRIKYLIGCILAFSNLKAQITFPQNGVLDAKPEYVLIKNMTLHQDAKTKINDAWLLIYKDRIDKIGKDFEIPKGTKVLDYKGKHVYPSFIELYSDYGMPEIQRGPGSRSFYETQFNSKKEGAYAWNQAIKPEESAANLFKNNLKAAEDLRKIGFGAVVSHQKDGLIRGNSALLALSAEKEQINLLRSDLSAVYSFEKGSSTQTYPVSLMGFMALMRQSFSDALWYQNGGAQIERNLSLEKLAKNMSLPGIFSAKTPLDVLRANKLAKEFNLKLIYKTEGSEYQRLSEMKEIKNHFNVGINFPKTPDVEDPIDAELVPLADMRNWELAPGNLGLLEKNGFDFSISISDLADKSQFMTNIEKAIKHGLSKEKALEALTTAPAKALKIDDLVGSIKPGLFANLIITDTELFEPKTKILENWVLGNMHTINDMSLSVINGNYSFKSNKLPFQKLEISGENDKPQLTFIEKDSIKTKATVVSRDKDVLTIQFKKSEKETELIRLNAYFLGKEIKGSGTLPSGESFLWSASLTDIPKTPSANADSSKQEKMNLISAVTLPFLPYGNKELPQKQNLLIKNATVWTNDDRGNIKADVWIQNGKIEAVGANLVAANVKVIDGTGKHLTNGIIDEHSHIALFSINEIETVSSEVRQEDAVNSEDIDILRQLAGGVTTSQLLHGSANVIGGQSAIIKLKWGEKPENLIVTNSPKFIKFALGENVKRGNAPSAPNRYPSTRMGVEQVLHDAFNRAMKYQAEWKAYNDTKIKTGLKMPRRDLELDALVEILEGKRHITCHSYVQSEINMLMQLADSLGFKVNTLTHILEGYKVADKMKARGVNASTFSDWWAYKMEVKEAIPQNAAIMTKVGVNTAINSDDAEMARRLNQEAAKTVLYGGLTEIEAWKTVTLNPAKMLHLEDRLGTIAKGKDADLVLWNENPLSVYAKPEKTIIEGAIYFDLENYDAQNKAVKEEKNKLIQKMIAEKSKGAPTVKPTARPIKPAHVHCDTVLEYGGISVEHLDAYLESLNKQ
jgi:imidazolonepropionase-like amidohydrolase